MNAIYTNNTIVSVFCPSPVLRQALAGFPAGPAAEAQPSQTLANPRYQTRIMSDHFLDHVLLNIGEVWRGFADIGQVLDKESRVYTDDRTVGHSEWRKTTERLRLMAAIASRPGQAFSAGEAYLRVATHFRAALHCPFNPTDPSVKELFGAPRCSKDYLLFA